MKLKLLVLVIAAIMLGSCLARENDSTSGSFLVIGNLTGNDQSGKAGSQTAYCDVITNGSIFNDLGVATVYAQIFNPVEGENYSYYNGVIVDQIDVEYKRTDGRNVEGVDVPYHFSQPINVLVEIGDQIEIPFVLVRHVAKLEPPLISLREFNEEVVLQLVAKITLHGKDISGHRVAPVSANITVWCANFADSEPEPEPEP